jgi:hypothetical protein
MQAKPSDVPDHEGNVWNPDSNTPNAETTVHGDQDPVSGINILAKLGIQIGKVSEQVATNNDRVAQLARAVERNTPVNYSTVASGVSTIAPYVLNLGSPDLGTFWEVSSWAIGGLEANSAVAANFVGLYTSGLATAAGAGLANMVDSFNATGAAANGFPYVGHYSPGQVTVTDNEYLFCVIFTNGISYQFVSNAQMRVFNVIASQGQVAYTA